MPISNSQHCRNYNEKQKLNNLEEYKIKQRLKNQKYYNKLKNENVDIKHYDNDVKPYIYEDYIKEIKEDVKEEKISNYLVDLNISKLDGCEFTIYQPYKYRKYSINKSELQPQTIKLYFNCFKKVYKNYFDLEMDDLFQEELMKLLENNDYDIKYITEKLEFLNNDLYLFIKSLNKNELQYIYSILSRIEGFDTIICKLYPYVIEKQIEYQQTRENKQMDVIENDKYKRLSFNKIDILKLINEKKLSNREKILFSLFMLFPVRRPIDYIRMYLIDNQPLLEETKKINERNNYYYNGKFYFYRTKNKEIQEFHISQELNQLIINYIQDRKTGPLLLDNDNKGYDNSTIRIHIMKVFKKIYGISYSGVELRHYYSTYINNLVKEKKLTIQEHIKICEMMNHSYEENKKYSYIIPSE